ncbi:MAG: hypothetical protein AAGD22_06885 [Verrucomicrobiota bacterium]
MRERVWTRFFAKHRVGAAAVLAGVLALIPTVFWGVSLKGFHVDTPWRDEIYLAPLFDKMNEGNLEAMDWFRFHNDHPSTVFYGIFLLNAFKNGAHGDVLSGVSVAGLFVTAFLMLFHLLRPARLKRELGGVLVAAGSPERRRMGVVVGVPCVAILAAIFSPLQYANILFPMGLHMVLPMMFSVLAFLALEIVPGEKTRWGLALVFGVLASFSHGAGLAVWPALLLYGWLTIPARAGRQRAFFVGGMVIFVGGLLTLLMWLSRLSRGGDGGSDGMGRYLASITSDPFGFAEYFLSYAGFAVARGWPLPPARVSVFVGIVLLLAIGVLLVASWSMGRRRPELEVWRRFGLWMALLVFFMVAGFLTALARAGIGPEQALSSRYGSWALMGWAAVIGWGWQLMWIRSGRGDAAMSVATLLLIPVLLMSGAKGVEQLRVDRSMVLSCKAYIHLHRVARPVESYEAIGLVDASKDRLLPLWEKWDYLRPAPLDRGANISVFRQSSKPMSRSLGAVDEVLELSDGRVRLSGTAVNLDADRPADMVLFTDSEGTILDATHPPKRGVFWDYSVRKNRRGASAWTKTMELPEGVEAANVGVWVLDMARYKVGRLQSEETVGEQG